MTLPGGPLRRLLAEHQVRPTKALGQNFVVDPNTVERMVDLAELSQGSTVVEVGAGTGSLTTALARRGVAVIAIEVDPKLIAPLRAAVGDLDVQVICADALRLDWSSVMTTQGPATLVANLPYSVATGIVLRILEEVPTIAKMVVMVQREVGERWCASPDDHSYGAVSVKIAYFARSWVLGRVPSTVFVPKPKVESVIVRLERVRPPLDPSVVTYQRFEEVVRAAFAHRRKMLRRSLVGVVPPEAFAAADVSPTARAQELDVASFAALARGPS
ncbi:MAG: 16S rRNA (adenine(1518)-N(6)/adenine(1519)-N(6))-dimethyltransferase RsmA [Acidimicrobiales bacterium]